MKLIFAYLFCLLTLTSPSWGKPLVIATFSILGDMVHEIAQDKVEVKILVGPDEDSHVFEPRPQDARELGRADLIFVNGLGFEGWLDRLIEASGFKGHIVVVTQGITPIIYNIDNKEIIDPHAWHSLKNAQVYIDNIVKGLSLLLPKDAPYFEERGRVYKNALQTLEKETHRHLAAIPVKRRKVITGHKAFGYLGRDFNIDFFAPMGISTEAEPSAKGIAELIRQVQTDGIQAIFVENISNPRLIEQIANETCTHVGGVLYSDALSAHDAHANTYIKMMSFNLQSLVKAMREYQKCESKTIVN